MGGFGRKNPYENPFPADLFWLSVARHGGPWLRNTGGFRGFQYGFDDPHGLCEKTAPSRPPWPPVTLVIGLLP